MRKRGGMIERICRLADLPREALPGGFGATLSGQNELTVRGCRRILRFTPEEVRLWLPSAVLTVTGKGLLLTGFGGGSVTVTGEIDGIFFGEGRR